MATVLIHAVDRGDEAEWRAFLPAHPFGELVAAGRGRDVPVVVPTQFVLDGDTVLVHLAGPTRCGPRSRSSRRSCSQ